MLTCVLDGRVRDVRVTLGRPIEGDNDYVCEYEIAIGDTVKSHSIVGADGIQAVQLALIMVGSALSSLPGASDWRWNHEPYTGFPASVRDPALGFIPGPR